MSHEPLLMNRYMTYMNHPLAREPREIEWSRCPARQGLDGEQGLHRSADGAEPVHHFGGVAIREQHAPGGSREFVAVR